ncbi:MAG: patatin-like phospholipase family protein [Bacillota bacterium]|nr:patatin-like phospholipase family protein [Bacillota bacterium]
MFIIRERHQLENRNRMLNLALGGGGVKGIAYLGVFEAAENRGYTWKTMAGVSTGSLAGSFAAAGYSFDMMRGILDNFDMGKVIIGSTDEKNPLISRYIDYYNNMRSYGNMSPEEFLAHAHYGDYRGSELFPDLNEDFLEARGNFISNVVNLSREGYFCDGDYIEEWVSRILKGRGIATFADFKGGEKNDINPHGYKMRMTAVDLTRWKVITLPDDIEFYGIDPDRLEVAKAIRMSTSVPFAFKPVEIKKREGGRGKTYHIVDGGVLDNFPIWLVDKSPDIRTVGFKLDGGKSKIFSMSFPLSILKVLISASHDIGVPVYTYNTENVKHINAVKVSSLNFKLTGAEKQYLYESGKYSADMFFERFENKKPAKQYRYFYR